MATRWSKERQRQHEARFPPEERQQRRRLAMVRYRQRHRDRLAKAREVTNILVRQSERHGDLKRLAALLRRLAPYWIEPLRVELRARRPGRRRKT